MDSSDYRCEKSEQWIKNNIELIDKARNDRESFAKLIEKLSGDTNLRTGESVLVYDDICTYYWGANQMFDINFDQVNFLGEIFECDPFDDF